MHEWRMDEETAEEAKKSISQYKNALKKWKKYEAAVTQDPFFHPKHRRIKKLKIPSYPEGTWRYRDDPLRAVYWPDKKAQTVYTLEAGTVSTAGYKKKSRK